MFNQDILDKVLEKYGTLKSIEICEAISLMYAMKFSACADNPKCLSEFDYERDWWAEQAADLTHQYLCLQKNS